MKLRLSKTASTQTYPPPSSSEPGRENLNDREGQTDSTSVDKYCSTWTNKGDYLYNGEGQTGSTPIHRQIVFYLD